MCQTKRTILPKFTFCRTDDHVYKFMLLKTYKIFSTFFLLTSIFGINTMIFGQEETWNTLSMVEVERKFDPEFGIEIMKPKVSPIAMSLNGKVIEVEGYFIALTAKTAQSHFMLSRFPQSMCFFCGKAGPESAMQVFMKDNVKVPYSEEKIKIKGKLAINPQNTDELLYTITDAILVRN